MGNLNKWVFLGILTGVLTYLIGWHTWGLLYGFGVHPYPESSSTPWTYQLWSGFIPALAIISIFGGLSTHLRSINCHVNRCWRLGRFELAGGQFKVCHKHSPHPAKLTHRYILARHEEHMRCAGQPPSSSLHL